MGGTIAVRIALAVALVGAASMTRSPAQAAECVVPTLTPYTAGNHRLPDAKFGKAYSQTITASGGNGTGYTWQKTSGGVPAGMTHTALGPGGDTFTFSGTPTGLGDHGFGLAVSVTSPGGCEARGANYRINVPFANLSISQGVAPDPVLVGAKTVFTVDVLNHGQDTATATKLVDKISERGKVVAAHWGPFGGPINKPCTIAANVVCKMGNLTNGASDNDNRVAARIVVKALESGKIRSVAKTTSAVHDNVPDNNEATTEVTATRKKADIDIGILLLPDRVKSGELVEVKVGIENHGPEAAENVLVSVKFPEGAEPVRSASVGCSPDSGDVQLLLCKEGTLAPGVRERARIFLRPTTPKGEPRTIDVVARSLSSDYDDPVATNNRDEAQIEVVHPR